VGGGGWLHSRLDDDQLYIKFEEKNKSLFQRTFVTFIRAGWQLLNVNSSAA